jgi:hypothetical protein
VEYVNKLLPKIQESYVKDYWSKQVKQTSDFHKSEVLDYILSKFSPFVSDARIRNIVNQSESLSFENVVRQGSTVMVDFGKYYYDRDIVNVMSTLLLYSLQRYLRADNQNSVPIALYISEVERWNTKSVQQLLMYSRRLGLTVTASSSRTQHIPETLRYELLRSGTLISFNTNKVDSKYLGDVFPEKMVEQITQLKPYHAALATTQEGRPLPASIVDLTE